MATYTIEVTPEQQDLIEHMIRSGDYSDVSAVVQEALDVLEAHNEWLKEEVQKGIDAIEAGDFIEFDSVDKLADYFRDRAREILHGSATSEHEG